MGMAVRLGVIADDLTGANDTGVQFARQGARAIVTLDWHNLGSIGRHADVLVLSTNSRRLPPAVAAQRARLAAQALRKARVPAIYKKIDSTFRGNVGAELDAILDVYPARLVILAPAFPPASRAVIDGTLTVKGIPVHRTAIGRDPVAPVRQSHLPTLLRAQSRREVRHLPLETLRIPFSRLRRVIQAWRERDGGLVVADAVTPADLARLARLILREDLQTVVVGSAGLAAALGPARGRRSRRRHRPVAARHPILVVVGSPNPTSLAQVAWAERNGAISVHAETREILAGRERFRLELERTVGKLRTELTTGRDAILCLSQRSLGSSGKQRSLRPSASGTLSEFLGCAARRLARGEKLGALILCGGDIAVATCRALGADGIILGGEVEPGVPWGRLLGGEHPNLPVITKAGGFGTPNVFRAAIRFLRRRSG
jgi:uncharacterized protein YgbK (DUF1537 family)